MPKPKIILTLIFFIACFFTVTGFMINDTRAKEPDMTTNKFIFASYFESVDQLENICRLAESLREFGGRFGNSPVWAYHPEEITIDKEQLKPQLQQFNIEVRSSGTPERTRWFFYGGKAFAAAAAEAAVTDRNTVLVWIDNDAVVLSEPEEFDLSPDISLAYCLVMHNRSGSLFDQPPDPFWSRIYEKLELTDDMLFPMVTPADKEKIRAYFHAGMLAVRPQKGILSRWAEAFKTLYDDPELVKMCKDDVDKRIFLHQTALTGAVLHQLARDEMTELNGNYNYPIFFEKQYDAKETFNSIENAVVIRCELSAKKIGEDWHRHLAGPPDKIAWLKERLFKE